MSKPVETLERIKRKYNSLNDVPVYQSNVNKVDMDNLLGYIAYLEKELEEANSELELIYKEGYR